MMDKLKPGLWLRVFALFGVLGGLGNTVDAEDVADDQWSGLSGRELDIATGLELSWGIKILAFAVLGLLATQFTKGAARARVGASFVVTFVVMEIATVASLSSRGYAEDASFPVLPVVVGIVLAILALASCIVHWNEAPASE